MEMGPTNRYTLWRNTTSNEDLIYLDQGSATYNTKGAFQIWFPQKKKKKKRKKLFDI